MDVMMRVVGLEVKCKVSMAEISVLHSIYQCFGF